MNVRAIQLCLLAGAAMPLAACDSSDVAGEGSFADEMPEPLPAGQCAGSTSETDGCETDGTGVDPTVGTTGDASGDACAGSADCLGDAVCAAAWDDETEVRGALACEFACVGALDETRWCSDASSCCDVGAVCTERGYCVLPESTSASTSMGESSGGATSTGDGSGSGGSGETE